MQRSFGAPFLYEPRLIARGKGARTEPADLAWVDRDLSFVVLFYMTESVREFDRQVDHNDRQARKYLRLWSSKGPAFGLRGINRYGDECYVPFAGVRLLLAVYVVSCPCGIEVRPNFDTGTRSATLCVPDQLIHWVSSYGGTIVDLLQIVETYLASAAGSGRE